jgi:hypothetical protein
LIIISVTWVRQLSLYAPSPKKHTVQDGLETNQKLSTEEWKRASLPILRKESLQEDASKRPVQKFENHSID